MQAKAHGLALQLKISKQDIGEISDFITLANLTANLGKPETDFLEPRLLDRSQNPFIQPTALL